MSAVLVPGGYRPQPRPSWLSAPFWEAAARGELIVQRCGACQHLFFRPEAACPRCLAQEWSWERMSGRATVYSFTVVHRPPVPGMTVPYAVADVLLDEGVHMMTNIVGCDKDEVAIDMPVKVEFVKQADLFLPFFIPVHSSEGQARHAAE